MNWKSMLGSLAFLVIAVLAISLVGEALGLEIAFWSSLLISVGLTIVLTLALNLFRRRSAQES